MDHEGSIIELMQAMGMPPEVVERVSRLWGKSAAKNGGRSHLLLGHLLDTAAVAGVMWDRYLSPAFRRRSDAVAGGRGRLWLMWICGIHDCGKACPAFQALDPAEAVPVLASGLRWGRLPADRKKMWRHDVAGAALLKPRLEAEWGSAEMAGWVWPLVAGHHGTFPPLRGISPRHPEVQGRGAGWEEAQRAVVDVFTRAVGFADLADARPVGSLRKAEQLALSGMIVMADWIASDSSQFPGVENAASISFAGARRRAEGAWERLGLRGGWQGLALPAGRVEPLTGRLGVTPRASQRELVERAWSMPAPGLLVVEAPMGEGKTKAALAGAEILAARFGFDGVFVAMPTQATSDPMYEQVLEWVRSFDPELESQVGLLHGRRRFNAWWRAIWAGKPRPDAVDGGCGDGSGCSAHAGDDDYGAVDEDAVYGAPTAGSSLGSGGSTGADGPAHWFLGNKRGLLTAFAVGTVDHLLHAATRTRHVMLRFAGLIGKVVIVDEVHAADVYMRQILVEALRWLGQAGVPVVLLSATLPPAQRQVYVDAYLSGVMAEADVHEPVPEPAGYPCVTAAYGVDDQLVVESSREVVASFRASVPVGLAWLPDADPAGARVAQAVREVLVEGGVVLVVVNQVARAQQIYQDLLGSGLDGELHLLHGQLCAEHRTARTTECLRLMGPRAGGERPQRMVVIATQLAEQSFDVDADILITDLAPTDLLLQRIGRLHRHSGTPRPSVHRAPRVLVTGVEAGRDGVPRFLGASEAIYGRWSLLRAVALVGEAAGPLPASDLPTVPSHGGTHWSIPADVPDLVARAYAAGRMCPESWGEAEAWERQQATEAVRADRASEVLLCRAREWSFPTLEGLHYGENRAATQEQLDALVRDGDPTVEVLVVRRTPDGYRTVEGSWLGVHGEVDDDEVTDRLMGGLIRLPARLTEAARAELRPLPGWLGRPWLQYLPALVLEQDGPVLLGKHRVRYDASLGLVVESR
ncbi:CRISPR-associated helicase Cas3' [Streptomyces sp. NPDC001941]|uniref:CRISPR-associated helicase Cas3' n=1 Tax=Streptomyces sp. NPDC001941 TaxID=3154659 RepID=UPI0033258725